MSPELSPETKEKSFTEYYFLPQGFISSEFVAAEYNEDGMKQLANASYNPKTFSATVVFKNKPQKGNTIKFFYLNNLDEIIPIHPVKEISLNIK